MQQAGWTSKRALERKSGVGHSALYDALSGEGNPSPETVALLAKALGQEGPNFALSGVQGAENVSGLIGQAQAILDLAAERLPAPPTEVSAARAAQEDRDLRKFLGMSDSEDSA